MRKRLAALVAAFAALALVAANEPVQPSGTATTEMIGLTAEVANAPVPVDVTALDISTSATTVGDPLAAIDALVAEVNGTRFGEHSVRSDGRGSASSNPVDAGLLGVSPMTMSATATDTAATAILSASDDLTAAVELLGDAVLSLEQTGAVSSVNPDRSAATVGLNVSSLDLGLDDLLGDVLADLPLEVLLSLAQDLLGTVEGLDLSELSDAVEAVEKQLAVIAGLVDDYDTSDVTGSIGTLDDYIDGLPADPATLEADLATAQGLVSTAETLLADPSSITLGDVTSLVGDLDTLVGAYPESGASTVTLDALDLQGTLNDVADQAGTLAGYLDGLLETLTDLQGAVTSAVTSLANTLNSLASEIGALQGLLDTLLRVLSELPELAVEDLLDALEGANLVGVGDIEVALSSTADADSAEAQLNCVLAGAEVDCLEPVDAIDQVVLDAVGTVTGVLETLAPGAVEGDVVLRILGEGSRTASEGGTNTAEATLEILRLEIPSVNLDALVPDEVNCSAVLDGALCDLLDGELDIINVVENLIQGQEVDDVLSLVGTAVADLGVDLGEVDLDAAFVAVSGAIDVLDVDGVLGEIQTALNGVLDLLLGDLDLGLQTPSLKLVVDPTATAAFTPGAPAPPTGGEEPEPAPQPAPEPEPAPSLPATGGGLALLGVLALAGGVALRRRP